MNKSSKIYKWLKKYNFKKKCLQCGKIIGWSLPLKISSSAYSYACYNRIPKFCSLHCHASYFFVKGKNHPAYKNGTGKGYDYEFSKNAVRKTAKCEICGKKSHLLAHHIDHNPRNNILKNIKILCKWCHYTIHGRYKTEKEKQEANKKRMRERYEKIKNKKKKNIEQKFNNKFNTDQFYTASDLCKKLNLSRERIRQLRSKNRLPYIRIDGRFYYFFDDNVFYSISKRKTKYLRLFGKSLFEIARDKECSMATITRWLKTHKNLNDFRKNHRGRPRKEIS